MGNPEECSNHKIIDKSNSCYGFDHDGKFCDIWYFMKQKYPHIKSMKDIASATLTQLIFSCHIHCICNITITFRVIHFMQSGKLLFEKDNKQIVVKFVSYCIYSVI